VRRARPIIQKCDCRKSGSPLLTWVTDIPKFSLGSFSRDGLYWWDPDSTGDLFLTVKALGEVDIWSNGRIDPLVMAGGAFEGTTGTPSGGGYTIYYY